MRRHPSADSVSGTVSKPSYILFCNTEIFYFITMVNHNTKNPYLTTIITTCITFMLLNSSQLKFPLPFLVTLIIFEIMFLMFITLVELNKYIFQ